MVGNLAQETRPCVADRIPASEGCWYLRGEVDSSPLTLLVDSGASCCLIDVQVYEALDSERKTPLSGVTTNLRGADGRQLEIYGRTTVDLSVGEESYKIDMIVTQLGGQLQGIVGVDFLAAQQSQMDLERGFLICGGVEHELYHHTDPNCHFIRLEEAVVIPARSLKCVRSSVKTEGISSFEAIVDADHELGLTSNGLLPPRSVVIINKEGEFTFPLVNFGSTEMKLLPGTLLGRLAPLAMEDLISDWPQEGQCEAPTEVIAAACNQGGKEDARQFGPQEEPVSVSADPCLTSLSPDGEQHPASTVPAHLLDLFKEAVEDLTELETEQVRQLLGDFGTLFAAPGQPLGRTHLAEHIIDTGDHAPVKMPFRRFGPFHRQVIREEIDSMLEKGVIRESKSPWNNPIVVVKKAGSASYRICQDARFTNQVTLKDSYPLPNTGDCLDALEGARMFCTLDLLTGFWQIPLHEESKAKTAFSTPDGGHYEYEVLAFGLCNAPATFERLMDTCLAGLRWQQCLVFLDDVVVFGRDFSETFTRLQNVFERLVAADLKLKPSKCHFFREEVHFLGHLVSSEGVKPCPQKIEAVVNWQTPKCLKEVRSFLGLAGYYRKFIQGFGKIAAPLSSLTQKNKKFIWDDSCEEAFRTLKEKLTNFPVLDFPSSDMKAVMILDTDASDLAVGACLSQVKDGQEHVIAYASKVLSAAQRRYCVTYKELYSVIVFTRHFKHLLWGRKFLIRTDHMALKWLSGFRDLGHGMLARWVTRLGEFSYEIVHRKGLHHGNSDALSRRPIDKCTRTCQREDCPECTRIIGVSLESPKRDEDLSGSQMGSKDPLLSDPLGNRAGEPPTRSDDWEGQGPVAAGLDHIGPPGTPISGRIATLVEQPNDEQGEVQLPESLSNWMSCLSTEEIKAKQREDPHLSIVVGWKLEDKEKPSKEELGAFSSEVRTLSGKWKSLELHSGVLYRRWSRKYDPDAHILQLVTPLCMQADIFRHLHGSPLGGHFGQNKTIANVRARFYWPGAKADLKLWCRQCLECGRAKGSPAHRVPLKAMSTATFNSRVALDIVGPLPLSSEGNMYILTIMEYFTKFVQFIPLKTCSAIECADALVNHYIALFGAPLSLHSDQGANFESGLFAELCRLLGVKKTRTSSYFPAGDGLVERANRTLQQVLKTLVSEDRDDWCQLLPLVGMAYRSTVNESTGLTPNFMMFGREMDLPVDLQYGAPPRQESRFRCHVEYTRWIRQALQNAHQLARRNLKAATLRYKRNYDSHTHPFTQPLGSYVFRFVPPGGSKKLQKPWKGPYKVVEQVSDQNVLVQLTPESQPFRVHVNNLKCYEGRTPPAWAGNAPGTQGGRNLDPSQDMSEPSSSSEGEDSLKGESSASEGADDQGSAEESPGELFTARRGTRQRKPPPRLDW